MTSSPTRFTRRSSRLEGTLTVDSRASGAVMGGAVETCDGTASAGPARGRSRGFRRLDLQGAVVLHKDEYISNCVAAAGGTQIDRPPEVTEIRLDGVEPGHFLGMRDDFRSAQGAQLLE